MYAHSLIQPPIPIDVTTFDAVHGIETDIEHDVNATLGSIPCTTTST